METTPGYIRIFRAVIVSLFLAALSQQGQAQFDCTILCNFEGDTVVFQNDTTVCYKQRLYLFTQFADTLNYSWEPNGETGVIIEAEIRDDITYILNVYNDDSTFFCTDSITLNIYPVVTIEFEQVSKGCPDECKAQVVASASGGYPPYKYFWGAQVAPNDSSLALGLCSEENYSILVRDTLCAYDTVFTPEAYDMPEVVVEYEPDSVFRTNPQVTFTFENKSADSIPLTNWVWVFPDSSTTNQIMPTYVFVESDSVLFIYTTIDGCVDTILAEITVQEFELEVPNVFTPNGDGVNDTYEIPLLERYISNRLVVFNRWGQKVFEASDYNNDWDGGTLSDGVYFYILKCQGYWEEEIFRGSVSIYGSKY